MNATLPEFAASSRMLSRKEVMAWLGFGRDKLLELTNHPNENVRIPSYRFGKYVKYRFDELMWWAEKHRKA